MDRNYIIKFRWPVEQLDEKVVSVTVPSAMLGVRILHEEFIKACHLTEEEVDNATTKAIGAVLVQEISS